MPETDALLWSTVDDVKHGASAAATPRLGRAEEKKHEFLQLFMEQLKHQDPLSPMDHQDMAAQLAQFSALEENVHTNSHLESIRRSLQSQEAFNAASWVGKDVRVDAATLAYDGESASSLCYDLPAGAQNVLVQLVDAASGNVVRTFSRAEQGTEPVAAGPHKIAWDGLQGDGKRANAGIYRLEVRALDGKGAEIRGARAQILGRLEGVELEGGRVTLKVGGERVAVENILEVSMPS